MRVNVVTLLVLLLLSGTTLAKDMSYAVKLKTGILFPQPTVQARIASQALMGKHVIVQFEAPQTDQDKERLKQNGIELISYIPDYSYTARITKLIDDQTMQSNRIRWFDKIQPNQKLSPMITDMGIGDWARRGGDLVQFAVILHLDEDVNAMTEAFRRDFQAEIIGTVPSLGIIELIAPESSYLKFAEMDEVVWIETAMPEPEEHNNKARANTGAETVQAAPFNLSGAGITVAEWDGGRADKFHTDFGSRLFTLDGSTVSTHATHVAGTVIGDGYASSGLYRGMAPGATLLSQLWWSTSSELNSEYSQVINNWGATIATNSWGYGVGDPASESSCQNTLGNYFSQCAVIDELIRGSQGAPISICWSAGNQRSFSSDQCGSIGWTYSTIGALSTAKNIITVGAINSATSTMTSFSSWGPTDDGRLKPDVVGPGCTVTSCKPNGGYTSFCGTSMSTPATAGVLALLREQWEIHVGTGVLLPSTLKGIVINSADDLGRTGPDFSFGHGRVNAVTAATKIATGQTSYVVDSVSTGASDSYTITIGGSAPKLKVTIVWSDPGGSSSASQNLINDLDLVLIDPFGTQQFPWVLDPNNPSLDATTGEDHLNNVETVEIDNPTAGIWSAQVKGTNIPNGPQVYSLVVTPDSSFTPGNQTAVAAYNEGNVSGDPGSTITVNLWASNVGAIADSLHIQISDGSLWLQTPIDTVITLNPFDSANFSLLADIPSGSLSGVQSTVTMVVTSLTDTLATDQASISMITNTTYSVAVTPLSEDTVLSPDTYPFSVTVTNNGNGDDIITVTMYDDLGWTFTPPSQTVFATAAGGTTQASFVINVPAEVPHLAINNIVVEAVSSGSIADSSVFPLVASNSVFPPQLLTPGAVSYSQDRVYNFSWTDDGSDSYTLYLSSDVQFSTLLHVYSGISTGDFTLPTSDSLLDGSYYWAVRKFVGADSSSLQLNAHQLVVDNIQPLDVTADLPADGSYLSQPSFTFSYSESGTGGSSLSPEFATIELSQDISFTTGVTEYNTINGFSFPIPDSLIDGEYFWRVKRFDLAGNISPFSTPLRFVLDTQIPALTSLLLPANNELLSDDPLTIVWQNDPPAAHVESPEFFYLIVSDRADFTDFDTFNGFVYDTMKVLTSAELTLGKTYWWRMRTFDSAGHASVYSQPFQFDYKAFLCGDIDGVGTVPDIGDLTYLISYLFINGPAPDPELAGSVDCNSIVDIGDVTYLIGFLFISGPDPCCP